MARKNIIFMLVAIMSLSLITPGFSQCFAMTGHVPGTLSKSSAEPCHQSGALAPSQTDRLSDIDFGELECLTDDYCVSHLPLAYVVSLTPYLFFHAGFLYTLPAQVDFYGHSDSPESPPPIRLAS